MKVFCKKRILLAAFLCAAFFLIPAASAEPAGVLWNGREWDGSTEGNYPNRNCDIVSIGREPARVDSVPYADAESARSGAENYQKERSPYWLLLSQTEWDFAWYENPEKAEEGENAFFWQTDFEPAGWDRIFVPSVWQTEGYDYPIYTNVTQKFFRQKGNEDTGHPRDLPKAPTVYNPTGLYRRTFEVPAEWDGRRTYIVFEGVDAAMYLWVNGIQAGYAEDSFTAHEFDLTDYIRPGEENVLAVKVLRWCDGSWIEDQDMFDLSGIFRDVYLYAAPQVRVRDYSIVTDFDRTFTDSTLTVDASVRNYTDRTETIRLTMHLLDGEGNKVAAASIPETAVEAGSEKTVTITAVIPSPRKWSAEDPYLYTLILEEETTDGTVFESYRTGFRKITYKTTDSGWYEGSPTDHDLIRINGQPIRFNGADRHETHPEYGYALTREVMEEDIRILKENNINAVRTSHYPNNPYWYWLCDKYGIYLIDEANIECHSNMTQENERLTEYLSAAIIDREYSMIRRDRNHASVVMWSIGNENKNPEILQTILVQSYPDPEGTDRILHEYTKDRPWHYEQARDMTETGIDVRSGMYALPEELAAHGEEDGNLPMIECEYEHAMGNSEGNFDEYAAVFDQYRNLQGGFIWDLVDQSVYRVSEDGERYFGYGGDYGEARTHDGNFCANGLLLPDRTIQPEMAEVRYFYQMIRFTDLDPADGQMTVENWFLFTDIAEKYEIRWSLLRDDKVLREGILDPEEVRVPCVDRASNQPGRKRVSVPCGLTGADLQAGCEYFLNLEAVLKQDDGILKAGHRVAAEQFVLQPELPAPAETDLPDAPELERNDGKTVVTGRNFTAEFDEKTGKMIRYEADGRELIVPGKGPEGSFFRAATDNDTGFGYGFFVFSEPWMNRGEYVPDAFSAVQGEQSVTVSVSGTYPALNGLRLDTVYTLYGDGAAAVLVSITPAYNETLVYLPVAGVEMTVPAEFERMTWFGRGPEENYADRNHGTFAGRYSVTVTDNFFPYMKSSETGNRTGVRWIALTDDSGAGLLAVAGTTLEASALHYTAEELHRHTHPYELEKTEHTVLRLNAAQTGVGGDNAWSRIVTHEQYLLQDDNYTYSFVLSPLRSGEDPGEKSTCLRQRIPE